MNDKTIALATVVSKNWIDYNNHMSDWAYGYAFGVAFGAELRTSYGFDEPYRKKSGCTLYTMSSLIHYRREAKLGDPITITSHFVDLDKKRIHYALEMFDGQGQLMAVNEALLMHVCQSVEGARAAEFPKDLFAGLQARYEQDAERPKPEMVGLDLGIRRKT